MLRLLLAAMASFSAAAHGASMVALSAPIPFHDCRGLICVDSRLDGGSPRTLVLDTGNVNSWIVADVARSLAWTSEPIVRDGKPISGVQRVGNHEVVIGDVALSGKFLAFDRDQLGDAPPPAEGGLAYPLFNDRVVQIDYPHHVLRISAEVGRRGPPAKMLPGSLSLITFGKQGPPIVVGGPFTVNGKPVKAQIDTCYSGTLLVYDAAIDGLGLRELVAKGKPEFFADTDGGVTMLGAPIATLGFARITLLTKGATVYFSGNGKNPVHQPDGLFEATVGNALFKNSVLTLDFHTMTLNVEPGSSI